MGGWTGLDCQSRVSFTLTSTQRSTTHDIDGRVCNNIRQGNTNKIWYRKNTFFIHPPTIEWQYYLSREWWWSPKILLISSFIFPISSGPWDMSENVVKIGSDIGTHSGRKEFQMDFAHSPPSDSHINMYALSWYVLLCCGRDIREWMSAFSAVPFSVAKH